MISAEDFLAGHRPVIVDDGETKDVGTEDVKTRDGEATAGEATAGEKGRPRARGATPRRGSFRCAQAAHPDDADECREAALRLLDAAARSTGTLRDKLAERGYEPATIDATIDRLLELHLLDDRLYAESVTRVCANRMMGRRGTEFELRRRGVDRATAQRVVREAEEQGVFVDAAWQLGRAVAKKTAGLDPGVRRRRFWAAGGRKGHDGADLADVAATLFSGRDD
ncbi:regulatory protein RecX [Bifidobacterium choloepi]|uniref:Regulatory protein RecX n=1 Tax=Bifidobacterium choloepi TaxID=2614131 RepID=A0A6I5N392_9BIFI|nr:regulatory protein RecX [Bifidobacterium choloepi]NEG70129.1 regulatory protein RecX [Bifidobacterium choloepi]